MCVLAAAATRGQRIPMCWTLYWPHRIAASHGKLSQTLCKWIYIQFNCRAPWCLLCASQRITHAIDIIIISCISVESLRFIVCENHMGWMISNIGNSRIFVVVNFIWNLLWFAQVHTYTYIKIGWLRCLRYFHKTKIYFKYKSIVVLAWFFASHTHISYFASGLYCVYERDDKTTSGPCVCLVYANLASISSRRSIEGKKGRKKE